MDTKITNYSPQRAQRKHKVVKEEDRLSKERIHEVNELNRHLESRMPSILQEDLKLCALCDFAVNNIFYPGLQLH